MLRIGMLTSGGDCQALNAAMRGVVKGVCTKRDDVEIYGFEDGYNKPFQFHAYLSGIRSTFYNFGLGVCHENFDSLINRHITYYSGDFILL